MFHFKRKDGSVFAKVNPSKDQVKAYKKDGCKECDADGKVKRAGSKKAKREVHRAE